MTKLLIGSDPEVFLETKGGHYFSAHGQTAIIHGTKAKPEPTEYGAIQIDGTAVEINTTPTDDVDKFVDSCVKGVEDIKQRFPELSISPENFVRYEQSYFESLPPSAKESGCDPEFVFCPATRKFLERPPQLMRDSRRFAGGHIHLGWTKDENPFSAFHLDDCGLLLKALSSVVYPICHIDHRKKSLGRMMMRRPLVPNLMRPKPYGLEYRTPGNFWLFSEQQQREIFKRSMFCLELFMSDPKAIAEGKTRKLYSAAS